MEGLEISEVSNLALERTVRLDSEFYKKENLITLDLLKRHEVLNLTEITKVSDGNHNAISEKFQDTGIPYYRGQDVSSFFVENAKPMCIDDDTFHLPVMKRSHLKKGDVLLSIVGTIGKLSLVYSDKQATCSCKLAILRPFDVSAEFLAIFLESKYGQNQIKKFTRGAVQMGLILEDANQIFIPQLSKSFQQQIEDLVKSAHSTQERSKSLYQESENFLLSELGIDESVFKVSKNEVITNTKTFADFENSWRLDAEYYQPKYERLISKIQSQPHQTLGSIVNIVKSIEPGSEAYQTTGIPFVRISNMTKFGLSEPDIHLDNEAFNFPFLMPKKDTILLTKDGTVGTAYKVEKDSYFITSGAILHLTITDKKVLPDFLTLILNSTLTKLQSERDAGGSIIQHWKPSEIEQVIIPILPMDFQQIIIEKIQGSFSLKTKSEQLLSLAKRAVEIAIEEGEDAAVAWVRGHE